MRIPTPIKGGDSGEPIRLRVKNGTTAEMLIYEDIGDDSWFGGLSAKQFKEDLDTLGPDITSIDLRINSVGGAVFEGLAIYNLLRTHPAKVDVFVDGLAASISSVIAMAGDTITMAHNAWMMIHDPYGFAMGTATELRTLAAQLEGLKDSLVDTYAKKSTLDRDAISLLMADETWLNAEDAIKDGFIDSVDEQDVVLAAYASPLLAKFKKLPDDIVQCVPPVVEEQERPRAKRAQEIRSHVAQSLRSRRC